MSLKFLVGIFLAAILTENYILNKFLGICPFLGVSKKLNTAFGMSCAVTVVMVIATAVTWPVYTYVLVPLNLDYLQTVVFILIIAALVQLLETVMHKYMPPLYNALGIYLPLITTNSWLQWSFSPVCVSASSCATCRIFSKVCRSR